MSKRGHDYSTILIWSAALVTVVRYAAAFIASDMGMITGNLSAAITVAMGLSGLGMGVLDVVGGTYLFDGWRRVMPKAGQRWPFRFKVLTFFVIGLVLNGIAILVPFTMSRVTQQSMAAILGAGGWLAAWSILVNAAPYLLIGGVAIGNQVVTIGAAHSQEVVPGQMSGQMSAKEPVSGQVSVQIPDWRKIRDQLTAHEMRELAEMSSESIMYKYGLSDDRQARRWRKSAAGLVEQK